MLKIKQVIVVEGRYDKAKLASLVDAVIITTGGFDIFSDRPKLAMLRRLAERDGLILLTDSDAAGFRIRSHIAGAIDRAQVTHVYIPDLFGKESRKRHASAEGKLGVEGMPIALLREAFLRAGVSVDETDAPDANPTDTPPREPFTQSDLLEWGLVGSEGSAERRRALLVKLGLPARLNAKAMCQVLSSLYTREQLEKML